jgi:Na+/melibiose symporter-like transporter
VTNTTELDTHQKLALACGAFAVFFANQSIHAMASPYFHMVLGLNPLYLSIALAVPMLISALVSKPIGDLSDRSKSQWGRRKPFILVSGLVCGVCFYSIWLVPVEWSPALIFTYILCIASVFYIAVASLTISVKCIAFEASESATERSSIMAYMALFDRIGSLVYFWLFPLAQVAFWGSVIVGIQWVGLLVGFGFIGFLSIICAWLCKESNTSLNQTNKLPLSTSNTPVSLTITNRQIRTALNILLTIVFIKLGAIAAFSGFDFYLLVYFVCGGDLQSGAQLKAILSTSFALFSLLLLPLISRLSLVHGRVKVLIIIYSISCIGSIAKWFIYIPGNEWSIIIDSALGAPSFVAIASIVPSLLSDLSAKVKRQNVIGYEGFFVASHNKVMNYSLVFSMLVVGAILASIGFDVSLAGNQTESTITWMRTIFSGGTFLLNLSSIIVIACYPFKH